ncbi:hypothetical protein DFA_03366 [Cavenderia fasciculata]|uniref:Uncharacterized protein n=1 Tax=Cavenderia fasciculata TaxID=261658 RepID=F4PHD6_CACFS|nr:uncharacterized protein DFA_03366 [Cavenderia fasciculata]EGG25120.1 hypothetical protein DFA_03366 [Cavenderia fasciculata]|eukprot:XP_004362971.1 hypothetical protein DFA_03366 [Cavenderia fasciculata]
MDINIEIKNGIDNNNDNNTNNNLKELTNDQYYMDEQENKIIICFSKNNDNSKSETDELEIQKKKEEFVSMFGIFDQDQSLQEPYHSLVYQFF